MERNDEGIINNIFSETGDAASPSFYSQGFTPAMSTPGSGVFPPRTAFNFLFKALTALGLDVNRCGCGLPWDSLVNYYKDARVTGSDGKIYIALVANGPATTNQHNPTIAPTPPTVAVWALAFGTMASQNADAIAATGGAMNGVTIGLTTAAAANFTKAKDNGVPPTLPEDLTNKAYVDGTNVLSQTGYRKRPGGYIEQWTTITIPFATLVKSVSVPTSTPILDYWSLPNPQYVEFTFPITFPNNLLGTHAYVCQSPFSASNLGPSVYSGNVRSNSKIQVLFVESVASGTAPNQDLIISVKVWGN